MSELDFGISTAEIEQDIESILFDDGRLNKQHYVKIRPMVEELVAAFELHLDIAVGQYQRDLKVRLYKNLRDEIDNVIDKSVTNEKK